MFGYVRPAMNLLSQEDKDRYQGVYCGLCHAMGRRYGLAARFTLNYDFAFLAILLADSADKTECRRCPAHPFRKGRICACGRGVNAAADASMILTWQKLRDDVLGVFGDPELTGKPAGDDLREGKRTVLIAYALSAGSEAVRKEITDNLGRPDLDDDAVASLRTAIEESGALATTEALIAEHTEQAFTTLASLAVDEQTRSALELLAHAAVTRTA